MTNQKLEHVDIKFPIYFKKIIIWKFSYITFVFSMRFYRHLAKRSRTTHEYYTNCTFSENYRRVATIRVARTIFVNRVIFRITERPKKYTNKYVYVGKTPLSPEYLK